MFLSTHGIIRNNTASSAYTARTTAFIAATGISDTTIINALNTMDLSLISAGLDTKMKALYPFVGGTASTHKYNFMDARDLDAAFRLTFFGGWTHASTGATPNGTNGWAETYLNNSLVLSQNSTHLSLYSRTNNNNQIVDISNSGNGADANASPMILMNFSGTTYIKVNQSLYSTVIDGSSLGMRIASRIDSTTEKLYKNNSLVLTSAKISTIVTTGTMTISKWSSGYWSNREYTFISIGDGLSDTEASAFYSAIQTFQTSLSRQV